MGAVRLRRVGLFVLVGTEQESYRVMLQGWGIGDWGFNIRPSGGCPLTHRPSGRRVLYEQLFTADEAKAAVLALHDAFPPRTFSRVAVLDVASGKTDEWVRWVCESVVAAAISGDYVFSRRSR